MSRVTSIERKSGTPTIQKINQLSSSARIELKNINNWKISFSSLLKLLIERAGTNNYSIAKVAGVDPSYVQRLSSGSREPDRIGPDILAALASRLCESSWEVGQFYVMAGICPPSLRDTGWTKMHEALCEMIGDSNGTLS